jgi:hypothetical protein
MTTAKKELSTRPPGGARGDPRGSNRGQFKKGHLPLAGAGRKPGIPNFITSFSREAIIAGLTAIGEDGKGRNGLTGFVIRATRAKIEYGVRMLGYVTPKQVDATIKKVVEPYETKADIDRELAKKGLPKLAEIFSISYGPIDEAEIIPPGRSEG